MIFIFTPTKLKRKIIFVALRINKKFTFYCDKLSIETKKVPIAHITTFDTFPVCEVPIYFKNK